MLSRKPKNITNLPKGQTYLGVGGTFLTHGKRFDGSYLSFGEWVPYSSMFGNKAHYHYSAPSNSEIVKLNGGAPKKKKAEPTLVFNEKTYYGLDLGDRREIIIRENYRDGGFRSYCVDNFSNCSYRFGGTPFKEVVEISARGGWKVKEFDTLAKLCLWIADCPSNQ